MEQKQIEAAVKKVQRRLVFMFLLKWVFIGLTAGLFAGTVLLLLSHGLVVPHYRRWALLMTIITVFVFIAFVWLKRPSRKEAIRTIDEPTENRISTALKYGEDNSVIARLQRKESVIAAESFMKQIRQQLPVSIPKKWTMLLISFCFAFILLWFIPNDADEILAKRQLETDWIQQQEEKAEKLLEEQKEQELKTAELLPETEEVHEKVINELENVLDELQDAKTIPEALEPLEQALYSLDETLKQIEKELQKVNKALADQDRGSESSGSDDRLAEERKLQLEQLQKHAEDIARALAQMGQSGAEQLEADGLPASSTWRDGGLAAKYTNLPESGSIDSDETGDGSSSGGSSNGIDDGSSGEGQGEGQGQSQGEGAGTGTGSGSNGSEGQGSGQGGLFGGTGSGSRNEVSTPRIFEGDGNEQIDGGPIDGESSNVEHTGRGPAQSGRSTPYEQVFGLYEQEARQSLNQSLIPDSMKSVVRDYFTNIQPNP